MSRHRPGAKEEDEAPQSTYHFDKRKYSYRRVKEKNVENASNGGRKTVTRQSMRQPAEEVAVFSIGR